MKTWKKFMSISLAIIMAVGMCGCGNKGNGSNEGDAVSKQVSASPELAKQYVYKMQEIDLGRLQDDAGDVNVQGIRKIKDKIYAVMQRFDYSEEGGADIEYLLAVLDVDGHKAEYLTINTQAEEEGAEGSEESSEAGADTSGVYESLYFSNFQIVENGYVYAERRYDYSDYSDPDHYVDEHDVSVSCWNLEGELCWNAPLDEVGDNYYISYFVGQKDGSVVVILDGEENALVKIDQDGTLETMEVSEELQTMLENYVGMTATANGAVVVSYYDSNWQNMYVNTYDFSTGKAGETLKLPAVVASNLSGRFVTDQNGDLIYSTSEGVYKYHIGADTEEQVMSFVNSDLYITGFDAILPLDDRKFVAVYAEYDTIDYSRQIHGGVFEKVDAKDIPDKKVLVLGGAYLYGDIQKRVVDYNKSNSEYRIVMRDYSQYNTYDDYTACYDQLNNDIISGKMPDIVVIDESNLSLEKYINKGLLVDIGEMIEKDGELSQITYMDNVFDACRYNGKLYEVVPSFSIQGYMGKKSLVGDRTSWTMQDAMALLDSMYEGTNLFSDMTKMGFLDNLMTVCGEQFIDVSSGKCNFDTEEFRAYMKYAKSLPDEFGDDYYDGSWYAMNETQFRDNRTILADCYINEVSELVYSINGAFGEDVSFVGFPSVGNGQMGAVIHTGTTYALSARSSNQEGAWKFVRYYLTDEYQDSLNFQLPVKKSALESKAQKASQKPSYTLNGKLIEEEYHYWINNEMMEIAPLSQEQIDKIVAYISSVKNRAYNNTAVTNIVSEEMGAFFKNQKSAEEVSSLIQNRVQLYINENR